MKNIYIPVLDIHYEGTYPVGRDGTMLTSDDVIPGYRTKHAAQRAADRAEKQYWSTGCTGEVWTVKV